ncbi:ABC transporter permease [Paenibacillus sp. JX-17]|uniref:ABC transporter permease n=1 Tax=Paenibacillus lacisoli TaxID=3064525 RepID=A0ABT9CAH7_9BACL|nr:ABC transporter permease [Paenibacillus sp. JX-17]MDO7906269.1 ABC transporter permease [Paenibacillus sp. JX-17]
MLHLIKLELKKGKLKGFMWGPLLAYAIIAGFMALLYFVDGDNPADPPFHTLEEMLQAVDLFVRATFVIYAGAFIARLIISEFRDKTMALLFAYPVSRQKLISAKLLLVLVWTFTNVLIANLLIDALFIAINSSVGHVQETFTSDLLYSQGLYVLLQAAGAAGMSLLPLVVGLRRKSVTATLVSSIFIVMVVCSNNGGFSLSSIIAVPLSLGALGILVTYLSFRNIHRVDVG